MIDSGHAITNLAAQANHMQVTHYHHIASLRMTTTQTVTISGYTGTCIECYSMPGHGKQMHDPPSALLGYFVIVFNTIRGMYEMPRHCPGRPRPSFKHLIVDIWLWYKQPSHRYGCTRDEVFLVIKKKCDV